MLWNEVWDFARGLVDLVLAHKALGAVGTFAGLASLLVSWRNNRKLDKFSLPVMSVTVTRQPEGLPHLIRFQLPGDSIWLVTCVRTTGICSPKHLDPGGRIERLGVFNAREIGAQWDRRVEFDPGLDRGELLLNLASPVRLNLRFDVCLKNDPRFRKSVTRRCLIQG